VQRGKNPTDWKAFSTIGVGVREIRIQVGGQFRLISVAKFGDEVHVLHAFQKKMAKTAKTDVELAKRRLAMVIQKVKT